MAWRPQSALVASTDVKIILADVHTTCNVKALLADAHHYLKVLIIQSLAVNTTQVVSEGVQSDVLHHASLAEPCLMESPAVSAHNGRCCVSVAFLAVLHLLCTQDELIRDFSMLPWHSMAAVRCQVLLSSCTSLSASVPPIPPLRKICPCQEPDRTHCALVLRDVCADVQPLCVVVLWVRAVCSDCLPLLPAAQI